MRYYINSNASLICAALEHIGRPLVISLDWRVDRTRRQVINDRTGEVLAIPGHMEMR